MSESRERPSELSGALDVDALVGMDLLEARGAVESVGGVLAAVPSGTPWRASYRRNRVRVEIDDQGVIVRLLGIG